MCDTTFPFAFRRRLLTPIYWVLRPSAHTCHETRIYSRLRDIGNSLDSLLFDRAHLVGNLGRDGPVSDQGAGDLVDGFLLLGGVLDLDETEPSGSSERSSFVSNPSDTHDDLGGFDFDGKVGEYLGEGLIVDREGQVANKDGVLRRQGTSWTEKVVAAYLAGLASELELGLSGLPGLLLLLGLLLTLGGSCTLSVTVNPGLLRLGLPVSGLSLRLGNRLAIGTLCNLILAFGSGPSSLTR